MAEIIYTDLLTEGVKFDHDKQLWIYNGLDSAVTREVFDSIMRTNPQDASAKMSYAFERGMQGPALTMMQRGIFIDSRKRGEVTLSEISARDKLLSDFKRITVGSFDRDINPRSTDQLKELLYDIMNLTAVKVWDPKTKSMREALDREALERLQAYHHARLIIEYILSIRDADKRLQVLTSGIDPDGRFRCAYHVAGTIFDRWSSSKNVMGRGGNLQNVTEEMREMFIPDFGFKMGGFDLEQAESVAVGYLSGDRKYIEAIRSGDLHTYVCRLVWPNLPWTGDIKKDRKIAERKFYRHYDYRYMAKRGGHASNYYAKPKTISHHLHIPIRLAEDFQISYFSEFTGIRAWQQECIRKVMAASHELINLLGRRFLFFGNPNDEEVWRSAISAGPQSVVGQLLNIGLYKVWKKMDPADLQLLLQVHDAIYFQYRSELQRRIMEEVDDLMRIEVPTAHGTMVIGREAMCGWNWRKREEEYTDENGVYHPLVNAFGMSKLKASAGYADDRKPPVSLVA